MKYFKLMLLMQPFILNGVNGSAPGPNRARVRTRRRRARARLQRGGRQVKRVVDCKIFCFKVA